MTVRGLLVAGVAALALSAFATASMAGGTPSAAQQALIYMSELNVITLGNMTSGADVQGKIFVGGNLSDANTYGGGNGKYTYAPSSFSTVTVVGNIQSGSLNLGSGVTPAGVTVGGTSAANIGLNPSNALLQVGGGFVSGAGTNGGNGATIEYGGSIGSNAHPTGTIEALPANFLSGLQSTASAMATDLKDLSTLLESLPVNGTVSAGQSSLNAANPNDVTLTAVNSGLGYAIIDTTAAALASGTLNYDIPIVDGHYLPTVINVACPSSGCSTAETIGINGANEAYSPYLLWNFEGAQDVTFDSQIDGSILAPYATLTNHSNLEGTVVAQTFDQSAEVHLGALSPSFYGVPEPGTWAMLIAGTGLIGLTLRRRRRSPLNA
jgi:choice-of-anchor A domain-containing protein